MKKRALALVLTAAMVLGLTACGGSSNGAATDSAADGQTAGTCYYILLNAFWQLMKMVS